MDNNKEPKKTDEINRRDFLRKSTYAAAATPIVLSMLVEKASAYGSPKNFRSYIKGKSVERPFKKDHPRPLLNALRNKKPSRMNRLKNRKLRNSRISGDWRGWDKD